MSDWIDGSVEPPPGEWVLRYFEDRSGRAIGPVISMPIHKDGSHVWQGRNIYAKTLWWMPLPPPPPGLADG